MPRHLEFILIAHRPIDSLTFVFDLSEKSGKTIHLLKARSKPIQSGRKRKKVEVLGTWSDFKDSKKKPVAE